MQSAEVLAAEALRTADAIIVALGGSASTTQNTNPKFSAEVSAASAVQAADAIIESES